MIEADVTKNKKIVKLKDYYVFLLNDAESTFHDKPIYINMQKRKYEKYVSECKKWRSLIKTVVGRNITVLQKKQLDNVWSRYG